MLCARTLTFSDRRVLCGVRPSAMKTLPGKCGGASSSWSRKAVRRSMTLAFTLRLVKWAMMVREQSRGAVSVVTSSDSLLPDTSLSGAGACCFPILCETSTWFGWIIFRTLLNSCRSFWTVDQVVCSYTMIEGLWLYCSRSSVLWALNCPRSSMLFFISRFRTLWRVTNILWISAIASSVFHVAFRKILRRDSAAGSW